MSLYKHLASSSPEIRNLYLNLALPCEKDAKDNSVNTEDYALITWSTDNELKLNLDSTILSELPHSLTYNLVSPYIYNYIRGILNIGELGIYFAEYNY
jgi:hypothetical protein